MEMKSDLAGIIVGGVTFATFMIEAIGHYNMGYRNAHGGKGLKIPPKSELVKLAGVVGIASVINATFVKEISEWAEERYG